MCRFFFTLSGPHIWPVNKGNPHLRALYFWPKMRPYISLHLVRGFKGSPLKKLKIFFSLYEGTKQSFSKMISCERAATIISAAEKGRAARTKLAISVDNLAIDLKNIWDDDLAESLDPIAPEELAQELAHIFPEEPSDSAIISLEYVRAWILFAERRSGLPFRNWFR